MSSKEYEYFCMMRICYEVTYRCSFLFRIEDASFWMYIIQIFYPYLQWSNWYSSFVCLCQNDTNYVIHTCIYQMDRQIFLSRSFSYILILSKCSYDLILIAHEVEKELLVKMMMSISSYDLTLSLFYFDEEIYAKSRNELKSNFRFLIISWDQ